jgi:hypothetical protein
MPPPTSLEKFDGYTSVVYSVADELTRQMSYTCSKPLAITIISEAAEFPSLNTATRYIFFAVPTRPAENGVR